MGAMTSASITYTINKIKKLEDGRKIVSATLAFGNSSDTYPSGGIPLLFGSLGCPNTVDSFGVVGNAGQGYAFQCDIPNKKLMMLASAATGTAAHVHDLNSHTHSVAGSAHAHALLIKGGQASSTTNDIASYATAILGKEEATDATITAADSATKGGVQSTTPTGVTSGAASGNTASTGPTFTATSLAEPTGVAIAAQSIRVSVIGY